MKKIFSNTIKISSNIIEKVKNFVTNLTPAAKLRYIVISVLTVAVTSSLLVVVALSTGKSAPPTKHKDFDTGKTASIDFDNEIILAIGDESSSVSTTDDVTDDTYITTNETSGTDESTSDEESSSVVTDKNTEPTEETEPQSTGPSQDYNPDPQLEDTIYVPVTNPDPTETTTQTQNEHNPTETTNKATQAEPKPTETTTQAQTTPKLTETTTKAPQTEPKPTETTKPSENNPQPAGLFSVKDKKYDYKNANVSILHIENKSQQAYTITITGTFKDSSGKVLKTESKTFEGFPVGWKNYFVFQPGIKYSSVSWDIKADLFSNETVAKYLTPGNAVALYISSLPSDGNGNLVIPTSPEEAAKCKNCVSLIAEVGNIRLPYKFNGELSYKCDLVLFDNDGEIFSIGTPGEKGGITYRTTPLIVEWQALITNVLWEDKDTCSNILDNLNNATCIMSIKSVELSGS